ncbi:MAG TPA: YggT family protein [Candidatus Pacebacteria bacterium]|nr:YggT family protein [Candidatus Paceibacterota bacterium]
MATSSQTVEYLVYFFLGVLEILLAFRLIFKLTGASIASGFVSSIYGLTSIFILPFEGIFRRGYAQGVETTSILEPATLTAMIVYAVLIWGIIKLVRIFSGETEER